MAKRRDKADARTEQTITIPARSNAVLVRAQEHTWVGVFRGREEIMRDYSAGGPVSFQLPPGEYTLRTDGVLAEVSFASVERPALPGVPPGTPSTLDRALLEGRPIAAQRPFASLRDLPPDLLQRLLRYAERRGGARLDRATIDRIIEKRVLPDGVTLPPNLLDHLAGLPDPDAFAAPPRPRPDEPDTLPARLRVTVEAPGRNPVDGLPEVPADGASACTLTLTKVAPDGRPLDRAADNDEVYLRATGGRLTDAKGKPLRRVRLSKCTARVQLMADEAPRLVTVTLLSPALPQVAVKVDFVPPD